MPEIMAPSYAYAQRHPAPSSLWYAPTLPGPSNGLCEERHVHEDSMSCQCPCSDSESLSLPEETPPIRDEA